MVPFKRFVSFVCVLLGDFLNSLIAWGNPRPALVPIPVAVEARR